MSEKPIFKDEPLRPVYRRWICGERGCEGEMRYGGGAGYKTGDGRYVLWHRCSVCGREEKGENHIYPRVTYIIIEDGAELNG